MTDVALLYNPKAGRGALLANALLVSKSYPSITRFSLEDKDATRVVEQAYNSGARVIAAAGGDGTLSSVAHAILTLGLDVALGVIPIGTLNHFAKDLKIPLTLDAAFDNLIQGERRFIDVASVNERYFLNNSSIGFYPALVRAREALEVRGIHKWLALGLSLRKLPYHYHHLVMHYGSDEKSKEKRTPFVFVGNNKYTLEGLSLGSRSRIDEGSLFIALAKANGRRRMLMLILHALLGSVRAQRDFDVIGLELCTIESRKKRMLVAYDGEVERMQMPLTYAIHKKALCVIVPRQ